MAVVGLHLGDRDVVAATLDENLISHATTDWEGPSGKVGTFADRLVGALENLDTAEGDPIWISLPPGYIHLRRIPLEIAGERDRRTHLVWEAAQTLGQAPENLTLRHWASGSAAIWEAVRADLVAGIDQRLETAGFHLGGVCAEPVALYQAMLEDPETWQAGVALSADWVSIAAGSSRALVLAESIRMDAPDKQTLEDVADLVASRIRGRAERFASFSVAGSARGQVDDFARHLAIAAGIEAPLLQAPGSTVSDDPEFGTRVALAAGAARSSTTGLPS